MYIYIYVIYRKDNNNESGNISNRIYVKIHNILVS